MVVLGAAAEAAAIRAITMAMAAMTVNQTGHRSRKLMSLMRRGQEQLRVLMGGKGGGGGGASGDGGGAGIPRSTFLFAGLAAVVMWLFASFYTVKPEEQSVELFLGEFSQIGTNGLNFAPWPLVTYEKFNVTTNRSESLGLNDSRESGLGLMLTTDENIVDIDFQVVWNIKNAGFFVQSQGTGSLYAGDFGSGDA